MVQIKDFTIASKNLRGVPSPKIEYHLLLIAYGKNYEYDNALVILFS